MASPCRSSAIPCLICRYRGATRLLIYCAECKQVSIHRYCLSKFYREDESIHWICWKCEARIHWERKVFTRKVEKQSRTLKEKDVKRSDVTRRTNNFQRSNLIARTVEANQGVRTLKGIDVMSYVTRRTNYVQRSNLTARTTEASQGARTLKGNDVNSHVTRRTNYIQMSNSTSRIAEASQGARTLKGNDVNSYVTRRTNYIQRSNLTTRTTHANQGARTLNGNDVHRSNVARGPIQENSGGRRMILKTNLGFSIDRVLTKEKGRLINPETDFQTSFGRKTCRDVIREISQGINLKIQGKGIKRRRKIILDDIDFDEEYEQRDNRNTGERMGSLVTRGTNYFKEDSNQVLKDMDEIDKLQSHTACQRMCNNSFLLKGVEHAKPIDLKRTNKLLQNPKRVTYDGSKSAEDYRQKEKRKRRLILNESSSSEEDDVPSFDIDQDGKGLEDQRRYQD